MLLLNQLEIERQFGPSYPTGGARRFNAELSAVHRTPTHVFEFGYLKGYTAYAATRKRVGSFSPVEIDALLATYTKAKGKWAHTNAPKPPKDGAPPPPPAPGPAEYKFTPADDEKDFPSPVFAVVLREAQQLIMWHPACHVTPLDFAANPLTY